LNVERERVGIPTNATDEAIKMMGRADHILIDEDREEIYVKDDYGIHIIYECVFEDMKGIEEELLKIGSFYISKYEDLIDTEKTRATPTVDRLSLMELLIEKESAF
jgi:hypothetical protein